ncbi:hypothetical protein Pfo_031647 [Paulownia fortunei]|nr:hypothetical protein Pfo_031647 [Paulownia fortunei]
MYLRGLLPAGLPLLLDAAEVVGVGSTAAGPAGCSVAFAVECSVVTITKGTRPGGPPRSRRRILRPAEWSPLDEAPVTHPQGPVHQVGRDRHVGHEPARCVRPAAPHRRGRGAPRRRGRGRRPRSARRAPAPGTRAAAPGEREAVAPARRRAVRRAPPPGAEPTAPRDPRAEPDPVEHVAELGVRRGVPRRRAGSAAPTVEHERVLLHEPDPCAHRVRVHRPRLDPSSVYDPSWSTNRTRASTRVDFPAPLGPSSTTTSPGWRSNDTRSTAGADAPGHRTVRSRSATRTGPPTTRSDGSGGTSGSGTMPAGSSAGTTSSTRSARRGPDAASGRRAGPRDDLEECERHEDGERPERSVQRARDDRGSTDREHPDDGAATDQADEGPDERLDGRTTPDGAGHTGVERGDAGQAVGQRAVRGEHVEVRTVSSTRSATRPRSAAVSRSDLARRTGSVTVPSSAATARATTSTTAAGHQTTATATTESRATTPADTSGPTTRIGRSCSRSVSVTSRVSRSPRPVAPSRPARRCEPSVHLGPDDGELPERRVVPASRST